MKKRIISIVLGVLIMISGSVCAFSTLSDAQVYSFYGDNMLFKQNETAVIAGTAKAGSDIEAELFNSKDETVTKSSSKTDENGIFEVSFDAPSGSYEEYRIVLRQDGNEFERLENVVFGELWLASGQSNMQYPLGQAKYAREMMANNEKLNRNIRVLKTPVFNELNDTVGQLPSQPRADIPGSQWITGEDPLIYGSSAVAYFFADKMNEELDVPVGILDISLGGSTIASWISREKIESNEAVKNDFINYGKYVSLDKWDKTPRSIYYEMSTNYNLRIEAVKRFRLSGMIWYQGETDITWTADAYSRAFDLLQSSYTELFNHENGKLPIIFTQLASFYYSSEGFEVPSRNVDFSEMQQRNPESRALISIYDVPLTYLPEAGLIHPECKLEVGERMAFAALGLRNNSDCYTTATIKSTELKDGSVFVTLRNVGDKLMAKGGTLKGFSICGDDGIYVSADAEIVSDDTVRIYRDDIKSPRSAAYAYANNNEKSNLYATCNGEFTLPVSPFVTDRSIATKYWVEKNWADCDDEVIWHTIDEKFSGFYKSWDSENAEISFVPCGENQSYMKIESSENKFSVNPLLTFDNGGFFDADSDYSKYGTITFSIKNEGTDEIKLNEIKFKKSDKLWYSPAFENTSEKSRIIPADGEWHKVTFDLNKLYLNGTDSGFSYSNGSLKNIENIEFSFDSNGKSVVLMDNIDFSACETSNRIGFDADMESADNFLEKISAFFAGIIEKVASIFR